MLWGVFYRKVKLIMEINFFWFFNNIEIFLRLNENLCYESYFFYYSVVRKVCDFIYCLELDLFFVFSGEYFIEKFCCIRFCC